MKYKLFLSVMLIISTLSVHAEKVVTVKVCGNRTGYYVSEQHQVGQGYEHHTLTCTAGENNPCQWKNNPNNIATFRDPVPLDVLFYDENGVQATVDVLAINNAINQSLDLGNTSATIAVNNVLLTFNVTPVINEPNTDQIIIHLWVTN